MATHPDHSVQLNVKASADGASDDFVKIIESKPGVYSAEPLFPGESHPDLAGLYVVYLDESVVTETVMELRALPEIDYVETPEPRKLIRPKKVAKAGSKGTRSHR